LRGAKAHQTGAINSTGCWSCRVSAWRRAKPTTPWPRPCRSLPGLTFVYGRQSADTRSLEGGLDVGNARFAGQETLVIFDDVFVPTEHVFLDGRRSSPPPW